MGQENQIFKWLYKGSDWKYDDNNKRKTRRYQGNKQDQITNKCRKKKIRYYKRRRIQRIWRWGKPKHNRLKSSKHKTTEKSIDVRSGNNSTRTEANGTR